MHVILLERVAKLGQMGDIVSVKQGFARNFLLPQGKALRATDANKAAFEAQKVTLEAQNLETKKEAEAIAEKLGGQQFIVIRSASDAGALYGSVTNRDAADAATAEAEAEFEIAELFDDMGSAAALDEDGNELIKDEPKAEAKEDAAEE